jgi:hypothetical protein
MQIGRIIKQLKRQLDRMQMEDSDTISVFGQKMTTLFAEIRT